MVRIVSCFQTPPHLQRSFRTNSQTLEQLLLAYGRVAIGFSGGVDSSFLAAVCARIMPASTLLVHLTTPLIGTPEQTSFERSVDGHSQ